MPESRPFYVPARLRVLESGEAPPEVTFRMDPVEQAEYRRRWLDGEEIADIRCDIERHKEAAAKAAQAAKTAEEELAQSPAEKWRADLYGDSGPSY